MDMTHYTPMDMAVLRHRVELPHIKSRAKNNRSHREASSRIFLVIGSLATRMSPPRATWNLWILTNMKMWKVISLGGMDSLSSRRMQEQKKPSITLRHEIQQETKPRIDPVINCHFSPHRSVPVTPESDSVLSPGGYTPHHLYSHRSDPIHTKYVVSELFSG